ncbi:hypothetical protein NZD89_04265 [Alicyclobacillus fastidiosus]|uniref:Uncharacterized protein n=1 Tax=Alicyclobacillus fastidiosus TaxID=392011 RepID=A0ABY6ZIB7_9BACL|nr:hypothetical protein [Alicyclobacillus fastidiosus]WAH42664.1 hypothetical protein NZD89_04265 [Alicyclobacillus fastidiosus]GMA64543.1 hypothetical protein GCM10025859_49830 [Alicyclobacillus fastidiosus]
MNGRVDYYEKDYSSDEPLSTGEADAKKIIPKDAVFTGRTYTHDNGGAKEIIYVYRSMSIEHLWPADEFANADGVNQPGVFDVAYEYDTQNDPTQLMAVVVFAGDNP